MGWVGCDAEEAYPLVVCSRALVASPLWSLKRPTTAVIGPLVVSSTSESEELK